MNVPPTLDQSQPGQQSPAPVQEERRKPDMIEPIHAAVVLLHRILQQLERMDRGNEPFQLNVIVNGASGSLGYGSATRQGLTGGSGVVRFVHNPTAAAVTLTLIDGDNRAGTPMYSASLLAGASAPVWIPFASDIMATSGNGCQIAGTYRP